MVSKGNDPVEHLASHEEKGLGLCPEGSVAKPGGMSSSEEHPQHLGQGCLGWRLHPKHSLCSCSVLNQRAELRQSHHLIFFLIFQWLPRAT